MGNCMGSSKMRRKSTAGIAPYDCIKNSVIVGLFGPENCPTTTYIRFALNYKYARFRCVNSETPAVSIGTETVSGSREAMLRFIESRLPEPRFKERYDSFEETTPLVARVAWLQHSSVVFHMGSMVRWVQDLATRGGRWSVDPTVGSPRMEVKKFEEFYSVLLEIMLEHAQMEERVIFPLLTKADPGLCRAANQEHARDLPIMNGIKEDIKSIGVLETGSPDYKEALSNLTTRLKSLEEHCKEHFEEEEKNLLPLMEALEQRKEQQKRVLEECVDVMRATHSHLLNFLLQGLSPQDAMQYLDLISSCGNQEWTGTASSSALRSTS